MAVGETLSAWAPGPLAVLLMATTTLKDWPTLTVLERGRL